MFLGTRSPCAYVLDCSSNDVTMCSPGMEDSLEMNLWRHQPQLQMEGLWCHETKRSKRVLLCCDVAFLYENSDVHKNKKVSTFLSENLISVKSRSCEIFGQKCDLIHLFSLTQIDLDIGTTKILEPLLRGWLSITSTRQSNVLPQLPTIP